MAVDKNLFLHDLSVVLISKSEGPYLKEWLDYHLLAGVDHFYLYDNESPDNLVEVAKPYVKAGIVDYILVPGKVLQCEIYNKAFKQFKFQSRYMTFLDGDEFIYPKSSGGGRVIDVVDEILSHDPNAAGLVINWQCFGSNGHEKADYSRGVLERFTKRAHNDWGVNEHVKTIANSRMINFFYNPHYPIYFEGAYSVNENGDVVAGAFNNPITAEKIVINHYHTKSHEEYRVRKSFFLEPGESISKFEGQFERHDRNEIFDDGILKYREERAKNFRLPDKSHADERLFNALAENLSPTLLPTTPPDFYAGKMETFLTCRAVAAYLQTKLTDAAPAKFFEEAAIKAILKSITQMTFADARLLISELPNLLTLPYSVVEELRGACLHIIPQIMNVMRLNNSWLNYVELDYIQRLLKIQK